MGFWLQDILDSLREWWHNAAAVVASRASLGSTPSPIRARRYARRSSS